MAIYIVTLFVAGACSNSSLALGTIRYRSSSGRTCKIDHKWSGKFSVKGKRSELLYWLSIIWQRWETLFCFFKFLAAALIDKKFWMLCLQKNENTPENHENPETNL